ncbi:M50 family metallopeptidase [Solibacillus sp. FSL H8-0523]|uniref:metalloprotease n=1 Tax=Solibacillus sp. FSL H8-0523 TaxID=2954511 RepID=UPI0031010884
MKFSVHPAFLLLLLTIVLYGNIALYSAILISLFVHELGHFVAAKLVGVKVETCRILPYGGEMTLRNEMQLSYQKLILVALGGPVATFLGILFSFFLPTLLQELFIEVQLFILLMNLLPIWPLDGGRIVCFALLNTYSHAKLFEYYVSASFYLLTVIIIVLLYLLPQSLILAIVSLFLWSKVIGDWRIRKYRSAFEKHVMNRLT